MATSQEIAEYYDGYPDADASETWGLDESGQPRSFADAQSDWEAQYGEAPEPAPVPGPASPGAGMAAARAGDMTAHGGTIGPVTTGFAATVNIGHKPAACMGDPHICPMFSGPKAHAGGTIIKGSATVRIGGKPAARISDLTVCTAEPGQVAAGEFTVFIGDLGAGGGAGSDDGSPDSDQHDRDEDRSTAVADSDTEPHYADTVPVEQPPGESQRSAGVGTHWIEIELVDEAEQPVPGEQYLIRLPDGKEMSGGLDARGQVRITGIKKPGWCQIKFPNLDLAAWERWRPGISKGAAPASAVSSGQAHPSQNGRLAQPQSRTQPDPEAPANPTDGPADAPVPPGAAARGGQWRQARQGECISSIAKDTGHFWRTIWEHPANVELNSRRRDPNVLRPGDAVFVSNKRPKEDSGSTDQHHKFRRRGEPAKLRLQFFHNGRPRAGEPYIVEVENAQYSGTTDGDGRIECPIPGNARCARVMLGQGAGAAVYEVNLGKIDPITSITGVQGRLKNLGFSCGAADGVLGPRTREALRAFQQSNRLPVTGAPDDPTRAALVRQHDEGGA